MFCFHVLIIVFFENQKLFFLGYLKNMPSFVGEVNTSTEGTLWGEEIPNAFLQVMSNWADSIKQSIQSAVETKCHPSDPRYATLVAQCLETVKHWDQELKNSTVVTTLQLGNPRTLLLYEYCFLRYIREVNTVGSVSSLQPPPFADFAHRFLVHSLNLKDPVLAMRATMFEFIDFAIKDQPTYVPLLDGLAEELM